MQYVQKPITVQAFMLDRDVKIDAPKWFGEALDSGKAEIDESIVDGSVRIYGATIRTPQGRARAKIGDYIIMEPDGALCVRKNKKFKELYQEGK